jgi:hypothetical protein
MEDHQGMVTISQTDQRLKVSTPLSPRSGFQLAVIISTQTALLAGSDGTESLWDSVPVTIDD